MDAPAPEPIEPIEYESTGDASLDLVMNFLGAAGYGPEHPAIVAMDNGDFGPLEKELADRKIPGAAANLRAAKEAYARVVATENAKVADRAKVVYEAAGGKEQWDSIRLWASQNATDAEKTEAAAGLRQGGLVAKAVTEYLRVRYEKSGARSTKSPQPTTIPGQQTQAPADSALSPREYASQVAEARKNFRGRTAFEDSTEYKTLQARRRAFRG